MIKETIDLFNRELPSETKLVAVSKFHPVEDILEAYSAGQRIFAESRPQELSAKVKALEAYEDLEFHFIGHLQTNKLKLVLPYVSLVHSVDSLRLLDAIQKWAADNGRRVNVLLELHVASESTKQGFTPDEAMEVMTGHPQDKWPDVRICGLMAMGSFTDDEAVVEGEFSRVESLFNEIRKKCPELSDTFRELSMGMSEDWRIALRHGSTMVRIGSSIFGPCH